jgi:AFG3 family protein
MVTKLGMSSSLENISLAQNEYGIKTYSRHTNSLVDIEVHKIIEDCSARCRQIIKERESDVKNMSDALIKEETLDLKRITEVLGERPYAMPKSVADIINFSKEDEEHKSGEDKGSEGEDGKGGEEGKIGGPVLA